MDCRESQTEQTGCRWAVTHILFLLGVALGIRIYLGLKFPHVIFLHEADGIGYINIARNILENFSISNATHFPPFYPVIISFFSSVSGDYESGARYASIAMGALMVVPYYLACRYVMSARSAFCATFVAACFGTLVDYSLQPISQATYTALIALGAWLGLRAVKDPSPASLAIFGMTSAAIYLTRPEGILFFVVNFPVLLYVICSDHDGLKQKVRRSAVLLCSFLLPFFGYVISLKRFTGVWTVSGKSGVTSMGVDASMKLLPGGKTLGETAAETAGLTAMFSNISGLVKTYMTQAGKFSALAYGSVPGVMFFLALIGATLLVMEIVRHDRSGRMAAVCRWWLFMSPLALILPVMAFDKIGVGTGYILPFFMVLFACCAKGLVWLESWITAQSEKRFSLPPIITRHIPLAVATSLVLSWFMFMPYYQWISSDEFRFMSGQQDFLLRQTGHWFRDHTDTTAKLMARWSNIGYYGERPWAGLVDGSIEEVTNYAKMHGITHIVIDSDAVPRRRPQLKALLDPMTPQPGLLPVYLDDQFETRVVIYQVM